MLMAMLKEATHVGHRPTPACSGRRCPGRTHGVFCLLGVDFKPGLTRKLVRLLCAMRPRIRSITWLRGVLELKHVVLTLRLYYYLIAHGTPPDPVLTEIERRTKESGRYQIMQTVPEQGALPHMLTKLIGVRKA